MTPPILTSCAALMTVLLAPAFALAVTHASFDDAMPQAPGKMQVGGGAAGGDDLFSGFGLLRIGVLDDLDATVRAGVFSGLVEDGIGFEVGGAARFRFLRLSDTGVVDVAAIGGVSLAKGEGGARTRCDRKGEQPAALARGAQGGGGRGRRVARGGVVLIAG